MHLHIESNVSIRRSEYCVYVELFWTSSFKNEVVIEILSNTLSRDIRGSRSLSFR